jgi:hypothetical protein
MPAFIAQYNNGPQTFTADNMTDAVAQAVTLGRALYGNHGEPLSVNYVGPEHKPRPSGTRVPAPVRTLIVKAIKSANRERCGVDKDAQEEMRLYLDTWVVEPLRDVLQWVDNDVSTDTLKYRHNGLY